MDSVQVRRFVQHFQEGEKPRNSHALGMEFEHFVLHGDSLKAVPYAGDHGIEDLLGRLIQAGWEPVNEDKHLLGAKKDGASVSVEPGGQLEFNIAPGQNLEDMERNYWDVLDQIIPRLHDWGQVLAAVGYQPVSSISEITLLPKRRYRWMYTYLADKGRYAHNMMKGTASTQISLDYADETDFVRKSRVISYLAPIVYAAFDNAPFFEGGLTSGHAIRCTIWAGCDPDRCGFPAGVFDEHYSYAEYANYVLASPAMIIQKDGEQRFVRGLQPVSAYFDPEAFTSDELDYLLSMCFPDVRTRRYLEIRMGDSLPYPLNFGYAAFWKGLLYNPDNLQKLYDEALGYTGEQIEALKVGITKDGIHTSFHGATVLERFQENVRWALRGLSDAESEYLEPVAELAARGITPKDVTLERLHSGKKDALEWCFLGREPALCSMD